MRFAIVVSILAVVIVFGLNGCGKVPTWGELTGANKPDEPAPTPPPAVAPPPAVRPVAPTGPTPQEVIARFKALRPGEVTDAVMIQLTDLNEGLGEITEINGDGSTVTSHGFRSIDKLTNLRQLRLNSTRVDNETCAKIAQLSSLEVLALSQTAVNDVGVAALSGLQNLKHLELDHCPLTRNGFDAIGNFPSLALVSLIQTGMDNRELDLVCNARTLVSLALSENQIDDYGLAALGKLGAVESLNVGLTSVTGAGLVAAQHKGGQKSLTHLNMYRCPLNDMGTKAISHFKSMERLNLGEIVSLDDFHLKLILAGMKNLKYLYLGKCSNLNGTGLQALMGNKEIEEIHINGCQSMGDNPVIKILKTLKSLKVVFCGGTAITPNGISELKFALPELNAH